MWLLENVSINELINASSYHIPEVKIVTCEPLYPGKPSELFLKFCNPTRHPTQITLFPLDVSMAPITITDITEKGEVKKDDVQMVIFYYFKSI